MLWALLKKETDYAQTYAHFRKLCSAFLKKCWSTQISQTSSNNSERSLYGERGCWSWTLSVTDFPASNWTIESVPRDRHLRNVPIVPYVTRTWQWKPKPRCSRNPLHVICHPQVKKGTRNLLLYWKIAEICHFALKNAEPMPFFSILLIEKDYAFRSQICQKLCRHNCPRPRDGHVWRPTVRIWWWWTSERVVVESPDHEKWRVFQRKKMKNPSCNFLCLSKTSVKTFSLKAGEPGI